MVLSFATTAEERLLFPTICVVGKAGEPLWLMLRSALVFLVQCTFALLEVATNGWSFIFSHRLLKSCARGSDWWGAGDVSALEPSEAQPRSSALLFHDSRADLAGSGTAVRTPDWCLVTAWSSLRSF